MDTPLAWRVRLVVLTVLGGWAIFILCRQLYTVQIVEGAVFQQRAHQDTFMVQPVAAPRGRILDRRGRVLVSNQPCYGLAVTPGEVRDIPATERAVAESVNQGEATVAHLLSARGRLAPFDAVLVAHSLDPDALVRAAAVQARWPGTQILVTPQRRYPYGDVASHVLGYVGDISAGQYSRLRRAGYLPTEVVGKSGLEQQYETVLRGRPGRQSVPVDVLGRSMAAQVESPGLAGNDLQLSLDMDLQAHAEHALQQTLDKLAQVNQETTAGAVVVLQASTGRVLALVSRPNFEPARFAGGISSRDLARLMRDPLHPLLSRAYQAAYPPGSTFKLINACASLQYGLCTPQSVFYCSGSYKGFNCFVRSGHGSINFTESIAQSCDVTYYRLGDMLGISRLHHYASLFGLGRPTGIDLPDEDGGLVATPSWKRRVDHDQWYEGDTINMAIGQGLLVATPLQMAVAVAAIANGGRVYRPHLVDRIISPQHRVVWRYHPRPVRHLPVRPEYLAAVRLAMAGVVDHGTAAGARSTIVPFAGKTGTAEAVPTSDNPKGLNHPWFVSFAPIQHPQIVTVVMIVRGGGFGGAVCAPLARDIIEYWYTHSRGRS